MCPVCTTGNPPHPPGPDYDSKGVTAFNPGNFASNQVSITSNWPQITFNLLSNPLGERQKRARSAWAKIPSTNNQGPLSLLVAKFSKIEHASTHQSYPYPSGFLSAYQLRIRTRLDKMTPRNLLLFSRFHLHQQSFGRTGPVDVFFADQLSWRCHPGDVA